MSAPDRAFGTLASELLFAANRPAAERNSIDRLALDPLARGVPNLDVRENLASARALLTIEGASVLTLGIIDPEWLIEGSGILDTKAGPALFSFAATSGGDMRLTALDVTLDGLHYRLAAAARQDPDILTLTFEDAAVAGLRDHTKHRAWSRGKFTRAEAIGQMVAEVKQPLIPYFSPEQSIREPKAQPKYPDTAPVTGQTGFDKGASFKIKNVDADAEQMRQAATIMGVADQENLPNPGRVRKAQLVAAIGESSIRDVPNTQGSPYGGVFQALKTRGLSTEEQARSFLKGGNGFQAGGAIVLARDNPGMQVGEIAWRVEGDRSNFGSDQEATHFYGQWGDEADAIMAAWNGGGSHNSDTVTRIKSYQFTRGLPGKVESSWDAATRLAQEVNWRFFAAGGVAAFVSDDYLITQKAQDILQSPKGGPLLTRPQYSWDHGRQAAQVQLQVHAGRWSVFPGEVVLLRENDQDANEWGPLLGRWIVMSVDQDLLDPTDCAVTLIKPLAPRLEPAAEVVTGKKKTTTPTAPGGGTDSSKGYANPFKGATVSPSRVDQGVDYVVNGPIRAIGNARIDFLGSYSGFGTYLTYTLLDGPQQGKRIYISEGMTPTVKKGDKVNKGQIVAQGRGAIEKGWAQGPPTYLPMAKITGGYSEGQRTAAGDNFNELMVSLGAPRGTTSGRPTVGRYP